MLPLAIGAGMMLGGTALNMYGTHQRDKATRGALQAYQEAVSRKTAQERAALLEQQGLLAGLGMQRQGDIGSYISQLQGSQFPTTDEGFGDRQAGVLTDIKELTKGNDGVYAYQGAPRTQSEGQQGELTTQSDRRTAEALLADHTNRQISTQEQAASHRLALGEILRGAQTTSLSQRFQLAKALRDLDWQRKTAAMQGQLDDAQREGQWANMLGGLGTQAGGLVAMYGASQMGGGGVAGGHELAHAG